jgi:hypothetical protein
MADLSDFDLDFAYGREGEYSSEESLQVVSLSRLSEIGAGFRLATSTLRQPSTHALPTTGLSLA